MLARLVLEILGQMWDEAGDYLEDIKCFLCAVRFDRG